MLSKVGASHIHLGWDGARVMAKTEINRSVRFVRRIVRQVVACNTCTPSPKDPDDGSRSAAGTGMAAPGTAGFPTFAPGAGRTACSHGSKGRFV